MKAIVLQLIRTNDRGGVVRLFTESHGLRSYYVNAGKKHLQYHAMALLEVEERKQRKSALPGLSDVARALPLHRVQTDPARAAVALFVAEVLARCLAEDQQQEALFAFCWHTVQAMDLEAQVGVYPQVFLGRIIRHLGHLPDRRRPEDGHFAVLDLVSGDWVQVLPEHGKYIDAPLSEAFVAAGWESAEEFSKRVPRREDRRQLLSLQISFVQNHLAGDREFKSFAILSEVFA